MNRILQQGHWVDEKYQEWPNVYDISTPELTSKFVMAAYRLYLERYADGEATQPQTREYTLAVHSGPGRWCWRGGDDPNTTDPEKVRAWKHF